MSMQFNVWTKSMLTALLIALVALSWTRHLDTYAQAVTAEHFKSALAAAALPERSLAAPRPTQKKRAGEGRPFVLGLNPSILGCPSASTGTGTC